MNDEAIKAFIERVKNESRPCVVCGGQSVGVGLFFPDDAQAFGARPNKGRVIAYWLCRRHESWTKIPHKLKEIEDILKKDLSHD